MHLTYFTAGQLRSLIHLNGKNGKISLNGGKLAGNRKIGRIFMFMKRCQKGLSVPCWGTMYKLHKSRSCDQDGRQGCNSKML